MEQRVEERRGGYFVVSTREGIAILCSASEPAIHMEVRNCSFYFFCFLGGVTGLLAPRPPP